MHLKLNKIQKYFNEKIISVASSVGFTRVLQLFRRKLRFRIYVCQWTRGSVANVSVTDYGSRSIGKESSNPTPSLRSCFIKETYCLPS